MHPTPMHAHYLTVSESRRWAMDNPVGNPYHDFKTKEMPVVPVVVMAVGAYGMATAMTTMAFVAAGLTFASGAFALAGQITGNKTLSTIGMVAGVAAAGVGLWSAAGGFASGAEAASSASGAAAGGEAASSVAQAAQATQVAGTAADAATAANTASSVNLTLDAGGNLVQAGTLGGSSALSTAAPIVESATNLAGASSSIPAGTMSLDGVSQMASLASGGSGAATVGAFDPGLGAGIGENGAMSVTGSAPTPVDAAAGGAETGSSINIRTDGGAMQSEAAKAVKEGASYGSDVAGGSGSSSAAGSGDQGLLGSAKKFGEFVIDPKNKDLVTKTLDMGGQMFKAYSEKDLYDAQEELAKAQASGVQANIELARAKVEEVNYSLELAKKRQQNINTRATSAAAQAGAVNPNANIFSTAAKPVQGGLIFSGAK